jgi:hypothetical protein
LKQIALVARRVDAFCARLNDGLLAVALALAILTTAALLQRLPALLLQPVDTETGVSLLDF